MIQFNEADRRVVEAAECEACEGALLGLGLSAWRMGPHYDIGRNLTAWHRTGHSSSKAPVQLGRVDKLNFASMGLAIARQEFASR